MHPLCGMRMSLAGGMRGRPDKTEEKISETGMVFNGIVSYMNEWMQMQPLICW